MEGSSVDDAGAAGVLVNFEGVTCGSRAVVNAELSGGRGCLGRINFVSRNNAGTSGGWLRLSNVPWKFANDVACGMLVDHVRGSPPTHSMVVVALLPASGDSLRARRV